MNPEVLRFLGQLVVAVISGGVVVAVINNFLSPKTKAETRDIAQKTAQSTIDAALENLRADLADAREEIREAKRRADLAEAKADDMEAKADAVMARDRVLVQYLWDLMGWTKRWYDQGHPPGVSPPPKPPEQLDSLLNS
jgi:outer membrane murein-binding lipoprotein Lpp